MKNFTLFILAVALFGVMVAVSFLKTERANRPSTRPVEESLRAAPHQTATQDAQSAVPGEAKSRSSSSSENGTGAPPLAVGSVDGTNPTASGGAQGVTADKLISQLETSADKTKTAADTISSTATSATIAKNTLSQADAPPVTLVAIKRDIDESAKDNLTASSSTQDSSINTAETDTEAEGKRKANSYTNSKENEILDYFQERLDQLPDDLTSYEKKVAIKEVRDEVLEIFKITPARLNKLTKKHKINYP